MENQITSEELTQLVDGLNFAEKVERSLQLIEDAYQQSGNGMVVANSLGKDSVAVWHLAKQVSSDIRGFIVTTRYKPKQTVQFMHEEVARYPEFHQPGPALPETEIAPPKRDIRIAPELLPRWQPSAR